MSYGNDEKQTCRLFAHHGCFTKGGFFYVDENVKGSCNALASNEGNVIEMIENNINCKYRYDGILRLKTGTSNESSLSSEKTLFYSVLCCYVSSGVYKQGNEASRKIYAGLRVSITLKLRSTILYRTIVCSQFQFICEFAFWVDLGTKAHFARLHPLSQPNCRLVPPPLPLSL